MNKKNDKARNLFPIRCRPSQRDQWDLAADSFAARVGCSCSRNEWIRITLDAAAAAELKAGKK